MRHLLGLLLAALLVAGCGDDPAAQGQDDPPASSTPSDETGRSELVPGEVVFVSESAVGGQVQVSATTLDSEQAVRDFARQFEGARMGDRLAAEVAKIDVPDGDALVGAVVAVACDAPNEVEVETTPAGLEVSSPPVQTDKQCLVPVTTVALVTVPRSATESVL